MPVRSTPTISRSSIGMARRLVESATIAVVGSAALYVVGSVYTDAYYGRMSIEAAALDLTPPYIALQSIHALSVLLDYPLTVLVLYGLYRLFSAPVARLHAWYDAVRQRLGRGVLLLANLIVVLPLLFDAFSAADQQVLVSNSALAEVAGLLDKLGVVLLFYVVWLSLGPRASLFSQFRERNLVLVGLVFGVYLLGSLDSTGDRGAEAAEALMTGQSDSSLAVTFTMRDPTLPAPPDDLIFVTARNGSYVAVQRQPIPPSGEPVAVMLPFDAVNAVQLRRLNAAPLATDDGFVITIGSPEAGE